MSKPDALPKYTRLLQIIRSLPEQILQSADGFAFEIVLKTLLVSKQLLHNETNVKTL